MKTLLSELLHKSHGSQCMGTLLSELLHDSHTEVSAWEHSSLNSCTTNPSTCTTNVTPVSACKRSSELFHIYNFLTLSDHHLDISLSSQASDKLVRPANLQVCGSLSTTTGSTKQSPSIQSFKIKAYFPEV